MFDAAIIGAGPAGITCAKEAAKAGLKTILFDKERASFGGTCLNVGCIPTKFFLNSSKSHKTWQQTFKEKQDIVEKIKAPAIKYLESLGVTIKWGNVSFLDKNTLETGSEKVEAKNIIVATGSGPNIVLEHNRAIAAEELFNLEELPLKFLIVGAGYIGVEFACLLKSFGKEVLVVEKEEKILPSFDAYLAKRLKAVLETSNIKIQTGKDISQYKLDDFDVIALAGGRRPKTEGLGLDKIGIATDEKGWIKTDRTGKTNIDNIYACGDVSGKKLLAYTAEYQAKIAIDNITGKGGQEDYLGLPECVFSIPQLAKVGVLEEEAKQRNLKYKIIKSNFLKFSSSYVYGDTNGFIQILLDEKDKIIGAGIISNQAAELISLFSLCIKNNMSLSDLQKCVFIHPTLSEIIPLLLTLK
jgi:dihydrolipoamide dehydrogenase